ncbi:protein of unknown function [Paraburkholderia kururiensis]
MRHSCGRRLPRAAQAAARGPSRMRRHGGPSFLLGCRLRANLAAAYDSEKKRESGAARIVTGGKRQGKSSLARTAAAHLPLTCTPLKKPPCGGFLRVRGERIRPMRHTHPVRRVEFRQTC